MQIKTMYRLVADENKILTNGTIQATCVDVLKEKADEWTEIDAPVEADEEVIE